MYACAHLDVCIINYVCDSNRKLRMREYSTNMLDIKDECFYRVESALIENMPLSCKQQL